MKLKHTILTLAAAGMLSAQAYAGEAPIEALQPAQAAAVMGEPAAAAFTPAEMAALFEQNGQPMQLAALSSQEMQETEGAWLLNAAGAFVGGVAGAYGYMTNAAYNRNTSPTRVAWDLSRSIVLGAAWGAVKPVRSIGGAFGRLSLSAGRGAVIGYGSERGWW